MILAKECGARITPDVLPDLVNDLGGLRADVAMYQSDLPPAVIELKILDEGTRPLSIVSDRLKIERLKLRQIGFADRVIFNKVGLAGAERMKRERDWLDEAFSHLRIVEVSATFSTWCYER